MNGILLSNDTHTRKPDNSRKVGCSRTILKISPVMSVSVLINFGSTFMASLIGREKCG